MFSFISVLFCVSTLSLDEYKDNVSKHVYGWMVVKLRRVCMLDQIVA